MGDVCELNAARKQKCFLCRSFVRKGEVFAYVGRNQNLKDLKDGWHIHSEGYMEHGIGSLSCYQPQGQGVESDLEKVFLDPIRVEKRHFPQQVDRHDLQIIINIHSETCVSRVMGPRSKISKPVCVCVCVCVRACVSACVCVCVCVDSCHSQSATVHARMLEHPN
jgi:hypothetical protein